MPVSSHGSKAGDQTDVQGKSTHRKYDNHGHETDTCPRSKQPPSTTILSHNNLHKLRAPSLPGIDLDRSKSLSHVVKRPPQPEPHPQDLVYLVSMVTVVAGRRFSRVARQVYARAMILLDVPGTSGCVSQV